MIKHCSKCGEEFHARATRRRAGGQSYCRPCHGVLNRQWKEGRRLRLSLIGATSSGSRLIFTSGERDAWQSNAPSTVEDRALATRSHR